MTPIHFSLDTKSARWSDGGFDRDRIVFWSILIVAALLRLVSLGVVPGGLGGDEAEEGVEAMSIIATGVDRWGNSFPIFFPHVGIGMNPLYTYLTIPIFQIFGATTYNLRILSAVFGVLTVPVTYLAGKEAYSKPVGQIAMLLVAILPWHVMNSRWGVEYATLPFWFTLGIFTISRALHANRPAWRLIAFLPWAIGLYSYVSTLIVVGAIVLLTVLTFRRNVIEHWRSWSGGAILGFAVAAPLLSFLAVNVLKIQLPLQSHLPYTIPLLPVSRLAQVSEPFVPAAIKNITLFLTGFQDRVALNQSGDFLPLTGAAPLLIFVGVAYALAQSLRKRKPDFILNIVLCVIVPMCAYRLNFNRINWFYIPATIIVANVIIQSFQSLTAAPIRRAWLAGGILFLTIFTVFFYLHYFTRYNEDVRSADLDLSNGLRIGLESALRNAVAEATPDETVFVDAGAAHPYLYVLFYKLADIRSFQKTRQLRSDTDGMYHVTRFDRFVFERGALPAEQEYVFVSLPDRLPCSAPEITQSGPLWAVGRCR